MSRALSWSFCGKSAVSKRNIGTSHFCSSITTRSVVTSSGLVTINTGFGLVSDIDVPHLPPAADLRAYDGARGQWEGSPLHLSLTFPSRKLRRCLLMVGTQWVHLIY